MSSRSSNEFGNGIGQLILICVIFGLIVTIGVWVGGPILSVYTYANGWKKTSGLVKAGAIILPIIGAVFVFASIAQGELGSWGPLQILLTLSPIVSLGIVWLAYNKAQTPVMPQLVAAAGQSGEPTSESIELFNRAVDKWNQGNKSDDQQKLDVASDLALAIKEANAPFPRAHAYLAMLFNDMGKEDEAEAHANAALQQNPNEFLAQVVKIDVVLTGVKVVDLHPGNFVHVEMYNRGDLAEQVVGSVIGTVVGTASKSAVSLFTVGSASGSQGAFRREAGKLITIFGNVSETNTNNDEYLMMTDTLIGLGDMIKDTSQLTDMRRNLYSAVLQAPIDKLAEQGQAKVIQVRQKAQGRLLLLK